MLEKILNKIKKSKQCKHMYVLIDWTEMEENNVKYSLRTYKCSKCDNVIIDDSRKDKYKK